MSAIHLRVVELEGNGERGLKRAAPVFAPHHHGIAKLVSVLIDNAVELRLYHGRCADNHAVIKCAASTFFCRLRRKCQLIAVEMLQFIRERNIA